MGANLERKEALCAKAEALTDSTDWESTASQMRQLQTEWKSIGPVRKSKSEAVWQRFRAACDRFFERYKHRDQVDLVAKAAPREAVIRELALLIPADETAAPEAPDGLCAVVQGRAPHGSSRRSCRGMCRRSWPSDITRR